MGVDGGIDKDLAVDDEQGDEVAGGSRAVGRVDEAADLADEKVYRAKEDLA